MENIKINRVDVKPTGLVIVKYTNEQNTMAEATLNTKWQSNEVKFLQGLIGGCAYVTIEQKGKYTNITAVDMNSGVRSNEHNPHVETRPVDTIAKMDDRSKSIVAQCLTKCCAEIAKMSPGSDVELVRKSVLDDYNFFLKEL